MHTEQFAAESRGGRPEESIRWHDLNFYVHSIHTMVFFNNKKIDIENLANFLIPKKKNSLNLQ
jgi:hypothetical protein